MAESDDEKISKKIDEYAGLIPKSLAFKLVSTPASSKITKNSKNLSIFASIISSKLTILPNGRHMRTLSILPNEESTYSLILFDSNAKKYSHLLFGDKIHLLDAYESGGDLYLSTNGKIEFIERILIRSFENLSDFASVSFYNILCFVSNSDEKNKYFLLDENSHSSVLLSQNQVVEKFALSKSFVLFEKLKFVSGHFELSSDSRIFIQKSSASYLKITDLKFLDENSLEILTNFQSKPHIFNLSEFLFLIGEKIPSDLSLENFLKLKKQTLLNSVIVLDSDGRAKQIRSD